jgi:hypothetical protein
MLVPWSAGDPNAVRDPRRSQMAWARLLHTRTSVNTAMKRLRTIDLSPHERHECLLVVNNWRSAHSFPLNTFQQNLRRIAPLFDPECLVAQRIKRLRSIYKKLDDRPTMKLTQMQDIGGCRCIVRDTPAVLALYGRYKASRMKHRLVSVDDYINNPKTSGYRGIHLIYSYYSDRSKDYNELKIEVQLRSQTQHAWATAVETASTFTGQNLKGGEGNPDWLRFFALASALIAWDEKSPHVPETPDNPKNIAEELYALSRRLDVFQRLRGYAHSINTIAENFGVEYQYFILELNSAEGKVTVHPYMKRELDKAYWVYLGFEEQGRENVDVVLVSADDLAQLMKSYPNYFADTTNFTALINTLLHNYIE